MKLLMTSLAILAIGWTNFAEADWAEARCDIYAKGEDQVSAMIPCSFGQRQGNVTITRSDGVTHDLEAVGDNPGNYHDQQGRPAYRESGLGADGLIFRLEDESVYVYWDTSIFNPVDDSDNPTAPYSTADYDATALLRCSSADSADMGSCPAGILRMEEGQVSIVITNPAGDQFTINFMKDYVNATSGEVEATMENDTWVIILNGKERYEVPLAAIEGG
jgi:hypothetical protein